RTTAYFDDRENEETNKMIEVSKTIREEELRREEGRGMATSRSASLTSRKSWKSGGFSARSVEELQVEDEPSVNEWYEEQMAYMRESIADEEEFERREVEQNRDDDFKLVYEDHSFESDKILR
ncbi:hypothetical protein PFISCL1PPCAC_15323, partial [Pristionchus fissidentatus]